MAPGTNILHGQWASPTVAELPWGDDEPVPQAIFGGGDGWGEGLLQQFFGTPW